MSDPRVRRLAQVLVDYSVDVQPGQRVGILGQTPAAPLIEAVYERVLQCGAHPHPLVSLPGLDEIFLRLANDDQLAYVSPFQQMVYGEFDAFIALHAAANTRDLARIDPARQTQRRLALRGLTETYSRRSASGELKWVLTLFPTDAYAQDANMSLRAWEDFVYGACHVDGEGDPVAHWRQVHAEQQRLVDWLKGHDKVEVRGPNAELTLSVKERPFINADGTRNMPDGEIFTSPVEASAAGWVRFTYPVVVSGREIDGIELRFEAGRVVHAQASRGEDYLLSALDTDAGARGLGEFAIGTNFGIQEFTKQILFDEKIGGSIHLALGRGFAEAGGQNQSSLHWDMICDMRDGGEIWVDGELFYQNGQFRV